MNRVDGKVAVVTGGTQGLGAAIAKRLAHSGASGIITCGRDFEKGKAVSQSITNETGVPVKFITADLENVKACRSVIQAADFEFGQLNILVNAAGITDRGNLLNTSEILFNRIFAINTRAPFFLMQEAVKLMIRDRILGAIVNIGSTSSNAGQPFIAPYCASKGALATITRNSGFALMRNKIRVNQLNIGWMASDGEDQMQRSYHGATDNWQEVEGQKQPFGRLIQPSEVAKAVAFLSSDDSGMMTGSVIHFDQSVWGAYSGGPPTPDQKLEE